MAVIPLNAYAYLSDVKNLIRTSSTDAADDDQISELIQECSEALNDATNRQFYPTYESHALDTPTGDNDLVFDDDFVEVTSITNGDGSLLVANTDYKVYPLNAYPKRWAELMPGGGKA